MYHPVDALLRFIRLNLNLDLMRSIIVLRLQRLCQPRQILDRVRLDEQLVVEVVKQESQTLLRILDLWRKRRGSLGLYALHIALKDVYQTLCVGRDVGSVTWRVSGLGRGSPSR